MAENVLYYVQESMQYAEMVKKSGWQKGERMGMEETAFYTYVSRLLQETGHMTQVAPIYANCSIQTALFIENEQNETSLCKNKKSCSCCLPGSKTVCKNNWQRKT